MSTSTSTGITTRSLRAAMSGAQSNRPRTRRTTRSSALASGPLPSEVADASEEMQLSINRDLLSALLQCHSLLSLEPAGIEDKRIDGSSSADVLAAAFPPSLVNLLFDPVTFYKEDKRFQEYFRDMPRRNDPVGFHPAIYLWVMGIVQCSERQLVEFIGIGTILTEDYMACIAKIREELRTKAEGERDLERFKKVPAYLPEWRQILMRRGNEMAYAHLCGNSSLRSRCGPIFTISPTVPIGWASVYPIRLSRSEIGQQMAELEEILGIVRSRRNKKRLMKDRPMLPMPAIEEETTSVASSPQSCKDNIPKTDTEDVGSVRDENHSFGGIDAAGQDEIESLSPRVNEDSYNETLASTLASRAVGLLTEEEESVRTGTAPQSNGGGFDTALDGDLGLGRHLDALDGCDDASLAADSVPDFTGIWIEKGESDEISMISDAASAAFGIGLQPRSPLVPKDTNRDDGVIIKEVLEDGVIIKEVLEAMQGLTMRSKDDAAQLASKLTSCSNIPFSGPGSPQRKTDYQSVKKIQQALMKSLSLPETEVNDAKKAAIDILMILKLDNRGQ